MTKLLRSVLDFLYSDQSEPLIPQKFIQSIDECVFVHFLLTNLRREINLISKCDKMFSYLHGNARFSHLFNQEETQQIINVMTNGIGRPKTRLGITTFPFEWILWNLIKSMWTNGYNIVEYLYIVSAHPNLIITKEIIKKSLEFSKPDFGMKFVDEWKFLTENLDE
jgi:hypothetical protein